MDLAAWEIAVLIIAGLAGGFINVMAGGGSVITVPVMIFLGVPGPIANGTNRIPILAHNIAAALTYLRHGPTQSGMMLSLAVCAIPGAVAGALISARLPPETFNVLLAVVMAGVLVLMLTGTGRTDPISAITISPQRRIWGHLLMLAAGFWGGFIQIGMGFVLLPILNRVLGMDLVAANIHKVFIILLYTVSALVVFDSELELLWWVGAVMAIGNVLGGWIGARLTLAGGEQIVRVMVILAIAGMIVKLIWFT
ncbi:MAG: sulfite exporter TauE/SafE family protein [Pseudomonadota bacterium]|nr:sulfite exporter TauE/SafE family protein [Pseudomonadota bacterium]